MSKPLLDYTESEIRAELTLTASHVQYAYNDLLAELNRRAALRQGRVAIITSVVSAGVALLALALSLFAIFGPH